MTDGARRLVVDLAATSKNWALTTAGEARLRAEAPQGWEIAVVRAPTRADEGTWGRAAGRPAAKTSEAAAVFA